MADETPVDFDAEQAPESPEPEARPARPRYDEPVFFEHVGPAEPTIQPEPTYGSPHVLDLRTKDQDRA